MKNSVLLLFLLAASAFVTAPAFAQVTSGPVPVTIAYAHMSVGGDPNGLNYLTLLQFLNDNSANTSGHIAVFSDSGSPLAVSFNGGAQATTFNFTLQTGTTTEIQLSSSSGTVTSGWLELTYSPSNAETTELIQYRSGTTIIGEVGVPGTDLTENGPLPSTSFPAETSSSVNTGIAVANPNTTAIGVLVRVWDPGSGNLLASTTVALAPNAHIAKFLTELFPAVAGITQLRPQVSLDSCSSTTCTASNFTDTPGFIATALRFDTAASIFTTIPVIQSPTGGSTVRVLPQVAVGGDPGGPNYQTILYMSTTATNGVSGVANFMDNNGNLIPALANGTPTSGQFNFTVLNNRVTKIILSGSSTLRSGWVSLTLPGSVPLIVDAVYQSASNGAAVTSEASVLESPPSTESLVYVSGTDNIGIALANPQSTANTVALTLFNQQGYIAATANVTLPAYGHLAEFVSQLFPQFAGQPSFGGSLSMQSPLSFSTVSLRLTGGSIAALPTVDSIMFRPSITGLGVSATQRSTGQITFTIAVTDYSAYDQPPFPLANGTASAVTAGVGVAYISQNQFDGYYSMLLDGSNMINAASGTLSGTFQGGASNISAGTAVTFYIYVEDSAGNSSNGYMASFKF
jgi:hypothetical protein